MKDELATSFPSHCQVPVVFLLCGNLKEEYSVNPLQNRTIPNTEMACLLKLSQGTWLKLGATSPCGALGETRVSVSLVRLDIDSVSPSRSRMT